MSEREQADVTFSITLEGDELDVHTVSETLSDVEKMLSDIESKVRNEPNSSVKWRWGMGPDLSVVASVNGVSREQLERIVVEAQAGFEGAQQAGLRGSRVKWPDTFGHQAISSAKRIIKRLENLQSITIHATNRPPVLIETADISETVVAKKRIKARRRFHSSVEGLLELISHRGKLRAAIKEHGTGVSVQCTFPDEMIESIKPMFDRRVIAEGLVSYRDDGTPISITDITTLTERKAGRPLEDFIGGAPDLTDGLSTEEFMSKLRGYDEH